MTVRARLDYTDFANLVRGRIVSLQGVLHGRYGATNERVPVELILSDIGYAQMMIAIREALAETEREGKDVASRC